MNRLFLLLIGLLVVAALLTAILWRSDKRQEQPTPSAAPITVPGIQEMHEGNFSIRSGDVYLYTLGRVIVGRRDVKTQFSVRKLSEDIYTVAYKGYYLGVYPFVLSGKTVYSIRLLPEPCPWTIKKIAQEEFALSTSIGGQTLYLAVDDRDPVFYVTAVTSQDSVRVSNQFTLEE